MSTAADQRLRFCSHTLLSTTPLLSISPTPPLSLPPTPFSLSPPLPPLAFHLPLSPHHDLVTKSKRYALHSSEFLSKPIFLRRQASPCPSRPTSSSTTRSLPSAGPHPLQNCRPPALRLPCIFPRPRSHPRPPHAHTALRMCRKLICSRRHRDATHADCRRARGAARAA